MYYGWYGGILGIKLCNTGDDRYNKPGAIRLEHPSGRAFESSFGEICQIIRRNMAASAFYLFPCKPRYVPLQQDRRMACCVVGSLLMVLCAAGVRTLRQRLLRIEPQAPERWRLSSSDR